MPRSLQRLLFPKVKVAGKGKETVLSPPVLHGCLQCISPTLYETRTGLAKANQRSFGSTEYSSPPVRSRRGNGDADTAAKYVSGEGEGSEVPLSALRSTRRAAPGSKSAAKAGQRNLRAVWTQNTDSSSGSSLAEE